MLTNQSENLSICTTNYHQGDERTSQLERFLQFTLLGVGNFELFPNACQGSITVTGAHNHSVLLECKERRAHHVMNIRI